MSCEDDVMDYLKGKDRPVSRREMEKHFKETSENRLSHALVVAKRIVEHQLVGSPSTILRTDMYFLSPAWLEKNGERKIPRSTAKGICILKTKDQDVYTDVCYEFCSAFSSCAPDIKVYFKNNGLKWNYDESKIANSRFKRVLNGMGSYLI